MMFLYCIFLMLNLSVGIVFRILLMCSLYRIVVFLVVFRLSMMMCMFMLLKYLLNSVCVWFSVVFMVCDGDGVCGRL